jgi:hypothetical protein
MDTKCVGAVAEARADILLGEAAGPDLPVCMLIANLRSFDATLYLRSLLC